MDFIGVKFHGVRSEEVFDCCSDLTSDHILLSAYHRESALSTETDSNHMEQYLDYAVVE